jgi:hypothetical protein
MSVVDFLDLMISLANRRRSSMCPATLAQGVKEGCTYRDGRSEKEEERIAGLCAGRGSAAAGTQSWDF